MKDIANCGCPLCGAEMEHRVVEETHIYSCVECPGILFEYHQDTDVLNLARNLNKASLVRNIQGTEKCACCGHDIWDEEHWEHVDEKPWCSMCYTNCRPTTAVVLELTIPNEDVINGLKVEDNQVAEAGIQFLRELCYCSKTSKSFDLRIINKA